MSDRGAKPVPHLLGAVHATARAWTRPVGALAAAAVLAGCTTSGTPPTDPAPALEASDQQPPALGTDPRWDHRPDAEPHAPQAPDREEPPPGEPDTDRVPTTSVEVPAEIAAILTLPAGLVVTDTSRTETSTEEVVGLTGRMPDTTLADALAGFEAALADADLPVVARDESDEAATLIAVADARTLGTSLRVDDGDVLVAVDLVIRRDG